MYTNFGITHMVEFVYIICVDNKMFIGNMGTKSSYKSDTQLILLVQEEYWPSSFRKICKVWRGGKQLFSPYIFFFHAEWWRKGLWRGFGGRVASDNEALYRPEWAKRISGGGEGMCKRWMEEFPICLFSRIFAFVNREKEQIFNVIIFSDPWV